MKTARYHDNRTCASAANSIKVLAVVVGFASISVFSATNTYLVRTFEENGRQIDEIVVPGRPPLVKAQAAYEPVPDEAMGVKVLSSVPAFTWCYGCSATSAGMMMGYYDNHGYATMYTGPANGGLCPLNNEIYWGHTSYPSVTCGECPLVATHNGKDGRTTRGHVDDYWIDYNNPGPDPYIVNGWTEHIQADCTGDYMGTSQSKYANVDGSTTFFNYTDGSPLYDYTGAEPSKRDGCHGMKLYALSRGYSVTANFSQYIYGYNGNTQGFTYNDFKSEIDAGRPVMIQVSGHSMVGYGYSDTGNIIYIHDTWDNNDHTMTWGGSYNGLQHYGVTVLRLKALPSVTLSLFGSPMLEAGGVATVTATLSETSTLPVTVSLAFSGTATSTNDYTCSGTNISIPAGSLSGSVTLTVTQDLLDEPDESIVVDIDTVAEGAENGAQQITAIITDDDPPPVRLAGTVYYYNGSIPVADTTVLLSGDGSQSQDTLADGTFDLPANAGGNYTMTPGKTNDSTAANGVTAADVSLIQRHIVGLGALNSPYKLLAADANGSRTISAADVSLLQRLIVRLSDRLPVDAWRFVPADYLFADTNNPWTAPTNRGYTNVLGDLAGQDFVAIKVGDVNNSWTNPAGGSSLVVGSASKGGATLAVTPALRFQVGERRARPGERIGVGVNVRGFREVTSVQFTLRWDSSVLRYGGVSGNGLRGMTGGSFGTREVAEGKLLVAWYDPAGEGVTLPDGTAMFEVNFEVVGAVGRVTTLGLGDVPVVREASVKGELVALGTEGGRVWVVAAETVPVGEVAYEQGGFRLSVATETGRTYVLEYTDILPATNWTALPAVTGEGAVLVLSDPAPANSCRFYRVRVE